MRYESLDDERGTSPGGGTVRQPLTAQSIMPNNNNNNSNNSTPVGRIRLSSAILGLIGIVTGAAVMFLIVALRRKIDSGGGTHIINPRPGFSPIPRALESLERRGLWMSGRSTAPLDVLRSRLHRAEQLVAQKENQWEAGNCSLGNSALDAFAATMHYTNSTLSLSAAGSHFLGTDFALDYDFTVDLRNDNFGFDQSGGGIASPSAPSEEDAKSVLEEGEQQSLSSAQSESPEESSGQIQQDLSPPTVLLAKNNRRLTGYSDYSKVSSGLFNRFRHQTAATGPASSLAGVPSDPKEMFFFSNNTLIPGTNDEEDVEAVCKRGFPLFAESSCLGPPYLYISYHGGRADGRARAVCKFSRDGCAMGVALMPSSLHRLQHPRGLMIHGNYLFAAESDRDNSAILRYSHCNPSLGNRRELLEVLVTGKEGDPDAGLVHPYGFAKDNNGWLYVSAQDTFVVLRYDAITGEPAPLPPALQHVVLNDTSIEELIAIEDEEALEARDEKKERIRQRVMRKYRLRLSGHEYENFYNGTFVDLGTDGVRGIAFDGQGLLYVADKAKGLLVFDRDGYLLGQLPVNVRNPISVHYCEDRNSMWIGSADSNVLYEYDTVTWEMVQSISHRDLVHPAGFVTHGDSIYVVSQRQNKLLRFSMITGELENVVLRDIPDAGERLILSPC